MKLRRHLILLNCFPCTMANQAPPVLKHNSFLKPYIFPLSCASIIYRFQSQVSMIISKQWFVESKQISKTKIFILWWGTNNGPNETSWHYLPYQKKYSNLKYNLKKKNKKTKKNCLRENISNLSPLKRIYTKDSQMHLNGKYFKGYTYLVSI